MARNSFSKFVTFFLLFPLENAINVTVLYFSVSNVGSIGFYSRYPSLDAAARYIQGTYSGTLHNFNVIPVIAKNMKMESRFTQAACERAAGDVVSLFWEYYFAHEAFFTRPLHEHPVMVTSYGQ